jgi:outer membrane murein-binding lipoprotein Lpp
MARFQLKLLAAAVLSTALLSSAPSNAQTPQPNTGPTSATTVNPEMQKQLSPSKRAMRKQNRAACEKQFAQQQRLGHYRFMRQCLKG